MTETNFQQAWRTADNAVHKAAYGFSVAHTDIGKKAAAKAHAEAVRQRFQIMKMLSPAPAGLPMDGFRS